MENIELDMIRTFENCLLYIRLVFNSELKLVEAKVNNLGEFEEIFNSFLEDLLEAVEKNKVEERGLPLISMN